MDVLAAAATADIKSALEMKVYTQSIESIRAKYPTHFLKPVLRSLEKT
jgi:hypothetical protein